MACIQLESLFDDDDAHYARVLWWRLSSDQARRCGALFAQAAELGGMIWAANPLVI